MCTRRLVLLAGILLAAALTLLAASPAFAQSRPELPEGVRIRIVLLSPELTRELEMDRATATVHRADADSIAFRLDGSNTLRTAPWWRVQELDVSDGLRRYTAVEHLGATAMTTLLGAGVAYSSWHSCNDPESDEIWSCIVSPRRLGSSVRFGAWTGFAVGVLGVLVNTHEEQWRNVIRKDGLKLLIDPDVRSGFRVGVSFRF